MPRSIDATVANAALNQIGNNATSLIIASGDPADRAAALAAALCTVTIDSSDFTLAAGDVSGRKVTLGAQSGTTSAGGTPAHACLIDGSLLLSKTPCTLSGGGTLGSGQALTIPAYKVLEIPTPIAA